MLHEAYGLVDLQALIDFVDETLLDAGYDVEYETGDYNGYRIQNILTTTGDDAYFTPVMYATGTTFGLTLAQELEHPATATELITGTDIPRVTDLTFPLDAFMVVTNQRVVIGLRYSGNFRVLCAACLDYRALDGVALEEDPVHEAHLRNNNQAVFKVANPIVGRLLYAGVPDGPYSFNEALVIESQTLEPSGPPRMGSVPCATTLAGTGTDGFYGVLSGLLLSHSSVFHNLDYAYDSLGRLFRAFRDSASGRVLLVREDS